MRTMKRNKQRKELTPNEQFVAWIILWTLAGIFIIIAQVVYIMGVIWMVDYSNNPVLMVAGCAIEILWFVTLGVGAMVPTLIIASVTEKIEDKYIYGDE